MLEHLLPEGDVQVDAGRKIPFSVHVAALVHIFTADAGFLARQAKAQAAPLFGNVCTHPFEHVPGPCNLVVFVGLVGPFPVFGKDRHVQGADNAFRYVPTLHESWQGQCCLKAIRKKKIGKMDVGQRTSHVFFCLLQEAHSPFNACKGDIFACAIAFFVRANQGEGHNVHAGFHHPAGKGLVHDKATGGRGNCAACLAGKVYVVRKARVGKGLAPALQMDAP